MPIISISEAAKLIGKNRRTLQRHIAAGKLNKTLSAIGEEGIEISELIRVYGALTSPPLPQGATPDNSETVSQLTASIETDNVAHKNNISLEDKFTIEKLNSEIMYLHKILEEKEDNLQNQKEHINSLKQAMLMLENKEKKSGDKTNVIVTNKPWWKMFSR